MTLARYGSGGRAEPVRGRVVAEARPRDEVTAAGQKVTPWAEAGHVVAGEVGGNDRTTRRIGCTIGSG